jgi:hypothetical protein
MRDFDCNFLEGRDRTLPQLVPTKNIVFSRAIQTLFKGASYFTASCYQFMATNVKNIIVCYERTE